MSAQSDSPRPSTEQPCGYGDAASPLSKSPAGRPWRVALVDLDADLQGLLEAWLHEAGITVVVPAAAPTDTAAAVDLIVIDVPFPRQCGVDSIRRVASRHPAAPILALSSTFFPGIDCCGQVARTLGAACVLPKPVTRDVLFGALRRVLPA